MSTAPTRSVDNSYFGGLAMPSEGDHQPLVETEIVGTSADRRSLKSDQALAIIEAPKRVPELQGEGVLSLPHAAQLPVVCLLPVDAPNAPPDPVSIESETWRCTQLLLRQPRYSFSGVKAFLIISTICAPLAYTFGREISLLKMNIATSSITLPIDTQIAAPASLPQALPSPFDPQSIVAGKEMEPAPKTPITQRARRSDNIPKAIKSMATQLQPTPTSKPMTTGSNAPDQKSSASSGLGFDSEAPRAREPEAGVWTYCTVNLIPTGQLAVQNATSYQTCISAGKKCVGARRYADIQFFDRLTLTSKIPLELCYTTSYTTSISD